MAIQLQRISLPRGPGSLAQLTQSATHVLRIDRSGPALLVDLSGKKPVAHEFPIGIVKGAGSEPDAALVIESGGFSPDGARMVFLRGGTDRNGGKKPSVELIDTQSRALLSSFELKVQKPWGVRMHPDGERIFVFGSPETVVFSSKGKVLDRIGTERGFELSPSGTHMLFEFGDGEYRVRPVDKPKFVTFEASSATWRDDSTLITTTWKSMDEDVLNLVDASTGKAKKLATLPSIDSLEAFGDQVLATSVKGKKVEAFLIALPSGKVQRFELVGSPSGTRVSLGPAGAFIAVNWQKVLHVLVDGAAPAKKVEKPSPAPKGEAALLARIEAKAKAVGVKLAKGASEKAIAAAEKTLGVSFPAEVKAFYRAHDGSEDDGAVEDRELLSLSRMVSEWKVWKELLDKKTFDEEWWNPKWIPVTYDGSGNHHMLDLTAKGRILSFWHDDERREVEGKDLLSWLATAPWGDPDRVEAAEQSAQSGGFVRYEMAQKFWAVQLEGASFTVRFGKQGTDGQEQVKSFGDAAAAKKELDKLVASKVKKGYREV